MNNSFLQGIDTIIVRVSKIKESTLWYTEHLGFQKIHEDDKINLVVLDTFSPTSLTLWETDEKITVNPQTASYPIFRSEKAADAHQRLKDRGVLVGDLISDHAVTYFTFQDPDGNVLEVCQAHAS